MDTNGDYKYIKYVGITQHNPIDLACHARGPGIAPRCRQFLARKTEVVADLDRTEVPSENRKYSAVQCSEQCCGVCVQKDAKEEEQRGRPDGRSWAGRCFFLL
jgi:hypothetical protein